MAQTIDYEGRKRRSKSLPYYVLLGGCIGSIVLGVVGPCILAVYCAIVLNDMGGPLFWPILVIFGGGVGFLFGAAVGAVVVAFVREYREMRSR